MRTLASIAAIGVLALAASPALATAATQPVAAHARAAATKPPTAAPARTSLTHAAAPARAAPHAVAARAPGRMVRARLANGQTVTYNCSLAGNANKTACRR